MHTWNRPNVQNGPLQPDLDQWAHNCALAEWAHNCALIAIFGTFWDVRRQWPQLHGRSKSNISNTWNLSIRTHTKSLYFFSSDIAQNHKLLHQNQMSAQLCTHFQTWLLFCRPRLTRLGCTGVGGTQGGQAVHAQQRNKSWLGSPVCLSR